MLSGEPSTPSRAGRADATGTRGRRGAEHSPPNVKEVKVERLERVEIEVKTIEQDRVYVNFFACTEHSLSPVFLGGRAMFVGDRWKVSIAPTVEKV